MPFYRIQVSLENDTVEPRDSAVNLYHVEAEGTPNQPTVLDDLVAAMDGLYTALSPIFSANLNGNARCRIYNLEDPPVRVPVRDTVFTFTAPTATGFPNEVALVLSYQGALASGVNRRRNRGRVYYGPLASAGAVDDAGDMRPAPATIGFITDAADDWLMPIPMPSSSVIATWSVFSRYDALGLPVGAPPPVTEPTYTGPQLAAGFKAVVAAWVDNAYDTQRRRGLRPTARTNVP